MSSPHHIYTVTILEKHLDTFKHVNNAVYLELFEEARWDWITKNNYGVDKIQQTGLGPVVLEISVSFRKELTLRKDILIESYFEGYKGKIAKVKQHMRDEQGSICCTADFTFGLFDLANRKLVGPTDEWLKALGPSTT